DDRGPRLHRGRAGDLRALATGAGHRRGGAVRRRHRAPALAADARGAGVVVHSRHAAVCAEPRRPGRLGGQWAPRRPRQPPAGIPGIAMTSNPGGHAVNARAIVTVLLVALLLVPTVAPSQGKLTVGILHIGSITDAGYNQAHAEGIQVMKKNLPEVEVIEVENVPEGADAERLMESMIQRGARLIIPASFGYLEPALRVAQRHPDVKFPHPRASHHLPNPTPHPTT